MAFVDGIEADFLPVPAPTGVEVASDLAVQLPGRKEAANIYPAAIAGAIQDQRPHALPVGVSVRQDPSSIGRV